MRPGGHGVVGRGKGRGLGGRGRGQGLETRGQGPGSRGQGEGVGLQKARGCALLSLCSPTLLHPGQGAFFQVFGLNCRKNLISMHCELK